MASGEVFLPGTQPLTDGVEFGKVEMCRYCHGGTKNGAADPVASWQSGMMSQAMRDPVFRAALTVANQDIPGVGEYCIRCHSPRGWLEGRSKTVDGTGLTREDMHGVSCETCHRMVDATSAEAKSLVTSPPPEYGNGMMVIAPGNTMRGPYGDGVGAMPHQVAKSDLQAGSQLCATCHDVSNPLQAKDVKTQPPYAYGPIERTYSEWAMSAFAGEGASGTCQSCHFPAVKEGGLPAKFSDRHRDHFVRHGAVGGSTWVRDAIVLLWPDKDVSAESLAAGKERAQDLLRTAAKLELSAAAGGLKIRVTNLSGHKLPTGYPEGRRMWLETTFFDGDGKEIDRIGRYGPKSDTLAGKAVEVPTLLDPERTRIYECLPGISPEAAAAHGKPAGASLHFVLNDVMVKDNRIPPRGFANARFRERGTGVVGADYADGQHWDELTLALPPGTVEMRVRLIYQSVSWEYIKFLLEENRTDDWGRKLYDSWAKTGQGAPTVMAEATLRR